MFGKYLISISGRLHTVSEDGLLDIMTPNQATLGSEAYSIFRDHGFSPLSLINPYVSQIDTNFEVLRCTSRSGEDPIITEYEMSGEVKFSLSSDGINYSTPITLEQFNDLDNIYFRDLFGGPAHGKELFVKVIIESMIEDYPYVRSMELEYTLPADYLLSTLDLETPPSGFRKDLDILEQTYELNIEDGIAFNEAGTEYDFYTTPDRIKIRPLNMEVLVGGKESGVFAFEVVNGYEDEGYQIELTVKKGSVIADHIENYALLRDATDVRMRTKVEMSLVNSPFSPMYPATFNLSPLGKRVVYLRITPQLITTGTEGLQVKLLGRPL